jgi:hypothetical protein
MFFSEVVNSSIFICAGDSLWRPEKIQFFFNFFFVQILIDFDSFCKGFIMETWKDTIFL